MMSPTGEASLSIPHIGSDPSLSIPNIATSHHKIDKKENMTAANVDDQIATAAVATTTTIATRAATAASPAKEDVADGSSGNATSTTPESVKVGDRGRRTITLLSTLPHPMPGWIPNKEDDKALAQPLPASVSLNEVVLVHRWFCPHSAGLRATLNYFDIPQRRVMVDMPHKTVLEGRSDYKKTPIAFFLPHEQEEEGEDDDDGDESDELKGVSLLAQLTAPPQDSAARLPPPPPSSKDTNDPDDPDRPKRFGGFHGGLLPPGQTYKMRNVSFTFRKSASVKSSCAPLESSPSLETANKDELFGYQVNGSRLIFESLFCLMNPDGQSFRENLERGFPASPPPSSSSSVLPSCSYYPATVADEEEWLFQALPLAVFMGIVHRGDAAESFARHFCGLDGGCIPEMKYACLSSVLQITDNVSKTHPYSFVEQMKTFMLRMRQRNQILREGNAHTRQQEVEAAASRLDDDTASTTSSIDGTTLTSVSGGVGDDDEHDETTATNTTTTTTTATRSSTSLLSGEMDNKGRKETAKRQNEQEALFWSATNEPGLYDLKLYGAICVAIAIAEDKVRKAPPPPQHGKVKPKHPMAFRCWVHEDLIQAGALTWFRNVNHAYRTKRPKMEAVVPERAKNEVTRSFYGRG